MNEENPPLSYLARHPAVRSAFGSELRKLALCVSGLVFGIAAHRWITGEPMLDDLSEPLCMLAGFLTCWIASVVRTYNSEMDKLESE
jgi:hypothetical protein